MERSLFFAVIIKCGTRSFGLSNNCVRAEKSLCNKNISGFCEVLRATELRMRCAVTKFGECVVGDTISASGERATVTRKTSLHSIVYVQRTVAPYISTVEMLLTFFDLVSRHDGVEVARRRLGRR